MNILNTLKKYYHVITIGLIAVLLTAVIALYRCNYTYKKQIKQLETKIRGLKNNVELLETIIKTEVQIERETRQKIKKINNISNSNLNNELNKLWVQNTD